MCSKPVYRFLPNGDNTTFKRRSKAIDQEGVRSGNDYPDQVQATHHKGAQASAGGSTTSGSQPQPQPDQRPQLPSFTATGGRPDSSRHLDNSTISTAGLPCLFGKQHTYSTKPSALLPLWYQTVVPAPYYWQTHRSILTNSNCIYNNPKVSPNELLLINPCNFPRMTTPPEETTRKTG